MYTSTCNICGGTLTWADVYVQLSGDDRKYPIPDTCTCKGRPCAAHRARVAEWLETADETLLAKTTAMGIPIAALPPALRDKMLAKLIEWWQDLDPLAVTRPEQGRAKPEPPPIRVAREGQMPKPRLTLAKDLLRETGGNAPEGKT